MAGYIGSKAAVTQVDGYTKTEADDRYVDTTGDTVTFTSNEGDALLIEQADGTDVGSLRINNGSFIIKGKHSTNPVQLQTHDGNEDIEVDPDGFIKFETGGSERMRLTNDGLTFNGDTAAANALDDYEEGTWTPVFNSVSAPTYSSQNGKYTKIGNLVNCTMEIVVGSGLDTSDGSGVTIGGLPFATVVDEETALASLGRYTSILSSKASSVSAFRLASSAVLLLEGSNDNVQYSNCASSGVLQMAFTYRAT